MKKRWMLGLLALLLVAGLTSAPAYTPVAATSGPVLAPFGPMSVVNQCFQPDPCTLCCYKPDGLLVCTERACV